MHRIDDSKFLLFIEPKKEDKAAEPLNDAITRTMEFAMSRAKTGTAGYSQLDDNGDNFSEGSGWKGFHSTDCGTSSGNREYLLENGMITNSLAPYYLKYYRTSIPESEMNKVRKVVEFYKVLYAGMGIYGDTPFANEETNA